MRPLRNILVLVGAAIMVGCAIGKWDRPSLGPQAESVEPIRHLHRLSDRIYSGAQPEGDAAFAHLAALGVRTVISVDGARPDVDSAARHGIRYIHLPVGYDGIEPDQQKRIIAAARERSGPEAPVFIHCHHGRHRGPTAAAICAVAIEGWSNHRATRWMRDTGKTSPDYAGLYATAASFVTPSDAELGAVDVAALPAIAEPGDLVDAMVTIDRQFDRVRAIRAADWLTPPDAPDLVPSRELLLLSEHFDDLLRRHHAAEPGFRSSLEESRRHAAEASGLLSRLAGGRELPPRAIDDLESRLRSIKRQCVECHRLFRD